MSLVHIVCINQGNYQGEGVKYVNLLHDMVRRNLPKTVEGKFICYTDEFATGYHPGITQRMLPDDIKGWWCKLWLFSGEAYKFFPTHRDRIIYFDLDVCITGALDDIVKYDGEFATLTDFYTPEIYNSSVMAWRAGFGHHIWNGWNEAGRPKIAGGDQVAIWHLHRKADRLQALFPGAFVSYKQSARLGIPDGAKVVCFHGHPKPASIKTGWVPRVWCEGGVSLFDIKLSGNIEAGEVLKNIRYALASKIPFIGKPAVPHEREAVIIGGGPSLNQPKIVDEIRRRWQAGAAIIALNNAWRWLIEQNIYPDYHVLLDARDENGAYVPPEVATMQRLYAAQCSRMVLDNTPARKTRLWFPFYPQLPEMMKAEGIEAAFIGGGSTVGLMSLSLFYHMGFRTLNLFGYDSSYQKDTHHAYAQPGNDGEAKINVDFEGVKYVTTPWMVAQAQEFRELAAWLVNEGKCEIQVHGDGLLPAIARHMAAPPCKITQIAGIWWPAADNQASNIILQELLDLPKVLKHVKKFDTCVQAGGNVGLWPREFAKHFKHVWTFEPDSLNFECLLKNTEGINNITAHQIALGDYAMTGALVRDVENCGAYYLDPEKNGDLIVQSVDSFDLTGCDLLQLDVEGFEFYALMGAMRTIKKYHPVIVVEQKGLGDRYGIVDNAVPCLLTSLGYILTAAIARDDVYTWQPTQKDTPNE